MAPQLLDAALSTSGSVDSGSAGTTVVGVGGVGSGVSRRHSAGASVATTLECASLLTGSNVDSGSAAIMFVGVGGGGAETVVVLLATAGKVTPKNNNKQSCCL